MRHQWQQVAAAFGMAAVVAVGSRIARADDDPNGPNVIRLTEPLAGQTDVLTAASRYRIGIQCSPASETLHAQLPDLPKDQGLVVEKVIPDSPAGKAGINAHDILLTAGDKPLAQPADLTGLIEAGKGAELSIKLLRGGKQMTVTVKPEEEKALAERVHFFDLAPQGLDAQWPQVEPNGKTLSLTGSHELPADVSVNIYREGKNPAKITVKKGKQTWEVSENELDKLPEEIRRDVEPLVSGPLRINLKDLSVPVLTGPSVGDVFASKTSDLEDRVEKRLDDMNKRLDEMRSTLDKLRNERKGQEPRSEK
jgi:hypothetical protein